MTPRDKSSSSDSDRAASAGVPAPQSQPDESILNAVRARLEDRRWAWSDQEAIVQIVREVLAMDLARPQDLKLALLWANEHVSAMQAAKIAPWHVLRAEMIRDELHKLAAVGVPAPRPQIVKHRSGCKAWTADRAQRWQEGDQATCNCGAWRNWLEQDPAEVGVPAPPSTQEKSFEERIRTLDTWFDNSALPGGKSWTIGTRELCERAYDAGRAAAGVPARRAPQPREVGDCPLAPNNQHVWTRFGGHQCEYCMSLKSEVQREIEEYEGAHGKADTRGPRQADQGAGSTDGSGGAASLQRTSANDADRRQSVAGAEADALRPEPKNAEEDHTRGGKWGSAQADLPRRNDGD